MSYIKLSDQRYAFFDVDETLISHFPKEGAREFNYVWNGVQRKIWAMEANVDLISELRVCGYKIAIWSLSGGDHAERMVQLLGIEDIVDVVMSKPHLYVDDKAFETQSIPRVYKV